ncbi:MAG: DUF2336 domain-containing protein [Rhodospirillales bacterium]|nr:DUF2336 domain-containing protein [Rhodospirillales bacterium]
MADKNNIGPEILEKGEAIPYEVARELVQHDDPEVRRRLAARVDISAEILYFLAEDPSPVVRREIASNTAAPHQADLLLLRDADEEVRQDLARKIAKLAPELDADGVDHMRQATTEALEQLARDQMTRVRQILSETLKDVANAPPEVINRLARDVELAVAGPVLEFSPVLTDRDLLAIIESNPVNGSLSAMARRSQVAESVSTAIADSDDEQAITELLSNSSAQIREETLDMLIDRAPEVEAWHQPLVQRPTLSNTAAVRLAGFVADTLLKVLEVREDLDPETAIAVKQEVHRRIEGGSSIDDLDIGLETELEEETPHDVALRLHRTGELTEELVAAAVKKENRRYVIAYIAAAAEMPLEAVQKAFAMQSIKGIVALVWKAEFTMALASEIQKIIAKVPESKVMQPDEDGGYPLSEDDLSWQIDLFDGFDG